MSKWLPPAGGGYSAKSSSKSMGGRYRNRSAISGRSSAKATVQERVQRSAAANRVPPKSKGGATRAK